MSTMIPNSLPNTANLMVFRKVFAYFSVGGDEENRTPVRNLVLRDNLRVQSTDELFLFPHSPSTGVGSSIFIRFKSLAGAKLNR